MLHFTNLTEYTSVTLTEIFLNSGGKVQDGGPAFRALRRRGRGPQPPRGWRGGRARGRVVVAHDQVRVPILFLAYKLRKWFKLRQNIWDFLPLVENNNLDLPNRRVQQLLLYMRCLHLLSQTLDFSRAELKSKRLKPSTSVKTGEEISNLVEE